MIKFVPSYKFSSVLKIKRPLLCTILLSRLIVYYLLVIPNSETDDYAKWPLVLKRLNEGVHIK